MERVFIDAWVRNTWLRGPEDHLLTHYIMTWKASVCPNHEHEKKVALISVRSIWCVNVNPTIQREESAWVSWSTNSLEGASSVDNDPQSYTDSSR